MDITANRHHQPANPDDEDVGGFVFNLGELVTRIRIQQLADANLAEGAIARNLQEMTEQAVRHAQ